MLRSSIILFVLLGLGGWGLTLPTASKVSKELEDDSDTNLSVGKVLWPESERNHTSSEGPDYYFDKEYFANLSYADGTSQRINAAVGPTKKLNERVKDST